MTETGTDTDVVHVKLRGAIKLNRSNPSHAPLIDKMQIGKAVSLNLVATTTSAGDTYKISNDGQETVIYVVALTADMLELSGGNGSDLPER